MASTFQPPTPATPAATYNPTTGGANYAYTGGAFGANVQPVPMPQPSVDLGNVVPGLGALNTNASGFINNELMGKLSPDTVNAIRNATASYAVANGQPGGSNNLPGTIGGNLTAQTLGTTSQNLQRQGIQDYSSFVPTVSQTQTVNPAVQADINFQNATSAAAPNPGAAASYAQQLFQQYLTQLNKPPKTQAEKAGFGNNGEYITRSGVTTPLMGGAPIGVGTI